MRRSIGGGFDDIRSHLERRLGRAKTAALAALAMLLCGCAAHASSLPTVAGVRIGTHATKVRVVLDISAPVKFDTYLLSDRTGLVLDLPPIDWKAAETWNKQGSLLTGVHFKLVSPAKSRVVLRVRNPITTVNAFALRPEGARGHRLVIDLVPERSSGAVTRLAMSGSPAGMREDGARLVPIDLDGSVQNPAWSPDGGSIVFTRFQKGYNRGPADLFIVDLRTSDVRALISDGADNVSQPGSTWNAKTGRIIFSSTKPGHDEIYSIAADAGPDTIKRLTFRDGLAAYEPSFAPDGRRFVFESHPIHVADQGQVVVHGLGGPGQYQPLTKPGDDARQPNWSPTGEHILYQRDRGGQWDIWVFDLNTGRHRRLTWGRGDQTDATFSPDGKWIVFSSDSPYLKFANLYLVRTNGGRPIRLTRYEGYDGAPSWSPDGRYIVFESSDGYPKRAGGTRLWKIRVPDSVPTL